MTQPIPPAIPRFELPPIPGLEVGADSDAFDTLLEGREELASATGGVTAIDFTRDTLEEALLQGIDINEMQLNRVLKSAFGNPTQVVDMLSALSEQEAVAKYGTLLPLLCDYATQDIE